MRGTRRGRRSSHAVSVARSPQRRPVGACLREKEVWPEPARRRRRQRGRRRGPQQLRQGRLDPAVPAPRGPPAPLRMDCLRAARQDTARRGCGSRRRDHSRERRRSQAERSRPRTHARGRRRPAAVYGSIDTLTDRVVRPRYGGCPVEAAVRTTPTSRSRISRPRSARAPPAAPLPRPTRPTLRRSRPR